MKAARDPRFWELSGPIRLSEAGVRELARLVQAGASTDELAAALGMSRNHVAIRAREIRRLLGIQHPAEIKRAAFLDKVRALLDQGGTNRSIAAALGTDHKTISEARRDLGRAEPSYARLTSDELAQIDRRLISGERPRAIADDVGCHPATVWNRSRAIAHLIPTDFPPCACGRPHNHTGACRLMPDRLAFIREQLAAGRRMEGIAPEVGLSVRQLREYALPIIADLQAQGLTCACGQPISHSRVCRVTHPPRAIDPDFHAKVRSLLEQGQPRLTIAKMLGCSFPKVNRVAKPILAELAAAGARCGCGAPADHRGTCGARSRAPKYKGYVYSRAARTIPIAKRYRAVKFATTGMGNGAICAHLGLNEYGVTALLKDLGAAGRLPPECRCGLSYNHRGACRPAEPRTGPRAWAPRPKRDQPKKPAVGDAALERRMFDQFRKGMSNREISRVNGVPNTTVQRFSSYWKARKLKPGPDCICGRPFRHPGGCIKNTPGALGKRQQALIGEQIREGILPHQIADSLGVRIATVLKHSLPVREALFAAGKTCACGRVLGHPYWCSAKWDSYEMPRGHRPLAPDVLDRVAGALIRGEVVAEIAASAGIGADRVRAVRRALSPEDRQRRTRAIGQRIARGGDAAGAQIMSKIQAAVPRSLDRALRDDVVGELYLAVMEGRLEVEQIRSAVRSFVSRGFAEWQSLYGPKSLDAAISSDDDRTLGDLIEDTTTADMIDELAIGIAE